MTLQGKIPKISPSKYKSTNLVTQKNPPLNRPSKYRIKLAAKTVDEDPASCKRWISRKEIKSAKI